MPGAEEMFPGTPPCFRELPFKDVASEFSLPCPLQKPAAPQARGNAWLHFTAPSLTILSKWPCFCRGIAGKLDTRSSFCSAGGLGSCSPAKELWVAASWVLLVQQIHYLKKKHTSERHRAKKSAARVQEWDLKQWDKLNNCLMLYKKRRGTVWWDCQRK